MSQPCCREPNLSFTHVINTVYPNNYLYIIYFIFIHYLSLLDPSHKSQKAWDKYPTMHHFLIAMCTYVHIFVTKWDIVGYWIGALWDLRDTCVYISNASFEPPNVYHHVSKIDHTHIFHGWLIGSGWIMQMSQCQWSSNKVFVNISNMNPQKNYIQWQKQCINKIMSTS